MSQKYFMRHTFIFIKTFMQNLGFDYFQKPFIIKD